jgi:sugar phosphate isomerase/epimerase
LAAVRAVIRDYVSEVQRGIGARPFGVGLRLGARAAEELENGSALDELKALLDEHGLYVFTLNGFPYGTFHNMPVKECVYEPDWRSDARVLYTDRLARILAFLLPSGTSGSISTLPGGFRPNLSRHDDDRLTAQLSAHTEQLFRIHETTGKRIDLGLEPEPHCYFETIAETVAFLERTLLSARGIASFAERIGTNPAVAESFLRRHVGVCLDACHLAVEFEDPREAVDLLRRRGIRVSKVQVSAGLRCHLGGNRGDDEPLLQKLESFADAVYLHQVVERQNGEIRRHLDLPLALAAYRNELDAKATPGEREWRIHFHVPVFMERLAHFESTREILSQVLAEQRRAPFCEHFEVETYTWDVLPEEFRSLSVTSAIARELRWTEAQLATPLGDS